MEQIFLPWLLEGTEDANTLISDFWPPELWDSKFLFFYITQVVVFCCDSYTKQAIKTTTCVGARTFTAPFILTPASS